MKSAMLRPAGFVLLATILGGCEFIQDIVDLDNFRLRDQTKTQEEVAAAESRQDPQEMNDKSQHLSDGTADVIIADVISIDPAPVKDIAYWLHPTLAYSSLLITSGSDGLKSFDLESFSPVASLNDGDLTSIHVAYDLDAETPANAQAFLVASERMTSNIAVYAIDNISRDFSKIASEPLRFGQQLSDICGGNLSGNVLPLYIVSKDTISGLVLTISSSQVSSVQTGMDVSLPGIIDCVVDPTNEALWALTNNGSLYRFNGDEPELIFEGRKAAIALGITPTRSPVLFDQTTMELDSTPGSVDRNTAKTLFSIADASGRIHLVSEAGDSLGSIRFAGSFDYLPLDTATVFATGFGNFGTVYRGGMVAFAGPGPAFTKDGIDAPAGKALSNEAVSYVRLVPWNSIMSALSFDESIPLNPRLPQPMEDEDGVLNIKPTFTGLN